jgi:hypothetical protein
MNKFDHCRLKYSVLLLFLLSHVLFYSCKTKEWIPPKQIPRILKYDYHAISNNSLRYHWFSADFEADYSANGTVTSFSGQIRMQKDSFIWVSASAVLGIEVSRILLTPDTFRVIDRIHSTYLCTGFSYIRRQTHPSVTLGVLQALLIGNDIPGYDTTGFTARCVNNNCDLSCPKRVNLSDTGIFIKNMITFDKQIGKITQQDISTDNPPKETKVNYYTHENISGHVVPTLVKAAIIQETQKYLSLSFKNIRINIPQKAPFKIPGRYSKMK